MNPRLAALDFITGCLSVRSDPDLDEMLRSAIVSGRLEWQIILDIANNQKIAPTFWVALRKRRLIEYLPSEARDCLFKYHLLNALRNKGLTEQAIEVVRQLNTIGIEPILLKGSASLFVKTFEDPGSRVMVDLDILVPKQSAEDCWNALLSMGYLPHAYPVNSGRHHGWSAATGLHHYP